MNLNARRLASAVGAATALAVIAGLAWQARVAPDSAERTQVDNRPDGRSEQGELPPLASVICPKEAVNDLGVGKPCEVIADCRDQRALTCLAAAEANGFPFCTIYCFGLEPEECGRNARCIQRGDQPALCAPNTCADSLEVRPGPPVKMRIPCDVGAVNDMGVGKLCTTHSDCAGNKSARACPRVFAAKKPNWCTMLCSKDEECGPNAFCWADENVEQGVRFTVRGCAPVACRE